MKKLNHNYAFAFFTFLLIFSIHLPAKEYWSGEVRTRESFLYGKIEIRMRSADASGVTSTLFTYNVKSSTYNEIDIEIMGRYNNEVSFNTFTPDKTGNPFSAVVNYNPHRWFHVYAIEWTPDYVAWFVDGFEIYRQNDTRIRTLNLPQAIMMNFWPPSSVEWAGVLDPSKLPLYAYYDWIKYYRYDPVTEEGFTFEWKDDFDTFDQNRWIASNSTFGSNLSDFKANNVVVQDGYLILCMKKQGETGYSGGAIKDLDGDAPYMVHAKASANNVSVLFSESLDLVTAETANNYVIPGISIKSAKLQEDKRTVHLEVEGLQHGVSYNLITRSVKDLASPANTMSAKSIIVKHLPRLPLKVNVGGIGSGDFREHQVFDFTKDYGVVGGTQINNAGDINSSTDKEIYKTAVEDITSFNVRIPNGSYNIKLMMAETKHSQQGARVFDIYCNGNLILQDVDVFKAAGLNNAYEVTLQNIVVSKEMLNVYFKDKTDKPVICGIVIEPLITGVDDFGKISAPDNFNLISYPNPFNPTTNITYSIPDDAFVSLKIYDVLGNEITSLLNEEKLKGTYEISFNGSDMNSGVYFCRIEADNLYKTLKLMMLK